MMPCAGSYLSAHYSHRGDMISARCPACGLPGVNTLVACVRWGKQRKHVHEPYNLIECGRFSRFP